MYNTISQLRRIFIRTLITISILTYPVQSVSNGACVGIAFGGVAAFVCALGCCLRANITGQNIFCCDCFYEDEVRQPLYPSNRGGRARGNGSTLTSQPRPLGGGRGNNSLLAEDHV